MQINVIFETYGTAVAGVNKEALTANLQAELDKFAASVGAEPPKAKTKAAPPGAQGDFSAVQWLIDMASDPAMSKAYVKALIFAINALLQAAGAKEAKPEPPPKRGKRASKSAKKSTETEDEPAVRIAILGKEIALPAATSAINALLKQLGDEE